MIRDGYSIYHFYGILTASDTSQTHLPNMTFNIICIIRTFVFYRCTVVAQMVSLLKSSEVILRSFSELIPELPCFSSEFKIYF